MMRNVRTTFLFGSILILPVVGCIPTGKNTLNINFKNPQAKQIQITNVSFSNNQMIIQGSGLSGVTNARLKNESSNTNSLDESFSIESATDSKIVANGVRAMTIIANGLFDLILTNAEGAATFPVTFTVSDGAITSVKIADGAVTAAKLNSMGATTGQILKYNGTAWVPTPFTNTQLYLGTWNANTNSPDANGTAGLQSGDYYIVTTAGSQDLGSGSVAYNVGDWIIYNGTSWDKFQNSTNVVGSFNGRTGTVVPVAGDYTWAQITKTSSKLEDIADIDITGRLDGKILKWSASSSKWIIGDAVTGGGTPATGAVTDNEVSATADIAQSKIHNLTTDLAAKEPAITAAATTKYFRGDKTFVTLDTSVVTENTNLYFTNARALGVPLTGYSAGLNTALAATDTILAAFGKVQGQLNAKSDSSSYIDWSTSGVQTIDPSRLNLGVGNASKAVVTSAAGAVTVSATTATELGYVSGVTSAIQTQLNAKQATIDKTTTQPVSTVRIYGANANNYVELSAPTLTGNTTYKFPAADGTSGQVLSTDHSGNLSWVSVGASSISDGSITYAKLNLSDGDIPQAKVNGLVTALSGKEPTITAGTTSQYLRGDKSLSTFASDVIASVLTGLSTATNSAVAATDSILVAIGKLQAQISANSTSISGKADTTNVSQTITAAAVTGLSAPSAGSDAANKTYVDGFAQWTKSGSDAYRSSGNVGIGGTPSATLDVNGTIKSVATSNTSTTIDFSTGNLQYTSSACGSMTLNNMKSGTTYTLAVQGAAGGTCSFSAYTGVASGALTVKSGSVSLVQTANKHTLFTFLVMGSYVYVASIDGY